jgi:hypothetical protein
MSYLYIDSVDCCVMKGLKSVTMTLLSIVLSAILAVNNAPLSFITDIDKMGNNSNYDNSNAAAQTGSGANHNTTTATTATFHAKGTIDTLISHLISDDVIRSLGFGNSTNLVNSTFLPMSATRNALSGNISPRMYLAAGTWNIDVVDGKVKNLLANFTEVTTTGINPHTHTITNYKPANSNNNNSKQVVLTDNNDLKIYGYVDVLRNGQPVKNWINIPVKIFMSNGNIVSIDVDPIKTNYHFGGMPVFGIVTSLTDQNNNSIRAHSSIITPNNTTNTS